MSLREVVPCADELIKYLHIGHWGEFKLKCLAEFALKLVEQPPGEDIFVGGYLYLPATTLFSQQ